MLGDPVAYFDAVVEAIAELESIRDSIDESLTDPAGPFEHGKGSVGRLRELAQRAAMGLSLFDADCGRDGNRSGTPLTPSEGRQERCR